MHISGVYRNNCVQMYFSNGVSVVTLKNQSFQDEYL